MKTLTIDVEYVTTRTDKAVLCGFADGREVWIPLSQIDGEEDFESGPVDVAEWLVEQESLPLFEGDVADARRTSAPRRERTIASLADLGPVTTAAFGRGRLVRVDGDKSVVRFPDGKTRTLGSRYVKREGE